MLMWCEEKGVKHRNLGLGWRIRPSGHIVDILILCVADSASTRTIRTGFPTT